MPDTLNSSSTLNKTPLVLPQEKGRFVEVDIARSLCALLVVLVHLKFVNQNVYGMLTHSVAFYAMVPLFYIFTGYFLSAHAKKQVHFSSWTLFKKRFTQLSLPYVFWAYFPLFFFLLAIAYTKPDSATALILNKEPLSLFLWNPLGIGAPPSNVPLWFLRDLLFFLPFICLLLKQKAGFLFITALLCFCFPTSLCTALFIRYPIPESFGYIALGLALGKLPEQSIEKGKTLLRQYARPLFLLFALLNASVIVYFYFQKIEANTTDFWMLCNVASRLCGCLLLLTGAFFLFQQSQGLSRLLQKIAPASFFIFAAHVPCLFILHQILSLTKVVLPDPITLLVGVLLFLFLGLIYPLCLKLTPSWAKRFIKTS